MPVLFVLSPLHAVLQSASALLIVQLLATAGAAVLFYRLQRRLGLEHKFAIVLVLVFLLSRRSHSALAGSFYPECFQAILTFAVIAAWSSKKWVYWLYLVLLLMTKEDASIYVAALAVLQLSFSVGSRPRGVATLIVAGCWCVLSLTLAIPASRWADGLSASNPLLEARFGSPEGAFDPSVLARRLLSTRTVGTLANVLAATALLPLAGPAWLLPAVPGVVINMAAGPGTMQSALTGHYSWPVLPWLFMAAAAGAVWLQNQSRRLASVWLSLLLVATVVDNPAVRRIPSTPIDPEAAVVLDQLRGLQGAVILAQPNLIPHLPYETNVFALGGDHRPTSTPDLVLMTAVGDTWPFRPDEITALVAQYRSNPSYTQVLFGPLHAFRHR